MPFAAVADYLAKKSVKVTIKGAEPYFLPGKGDTAILALHGWSASAESLRFLARGLADAGYSVFVPTLPGHGTSAEDMVQFGPLDWMAAASESLKLLQEHFRQVIVLGVSMGGALALQLAGTRSDDVAAVVTVNAPVFMGSPDFAREILSAPATASLAGWEVPAFMGPQVPEISYRERRKKSGVDLYAMCGLARECLPRITSPLLVFQAVADPVVSRACADEIMARVESTDKRLIWLDRSYHVSQLDLDRDRIVSETVTFAKLAVPT